MSRDQLEQVTDGIYVGTPHPGEGTMGVIVTPQVKIAIDSSSYDRFAARVKQAIDESSAAPWRYLILTHSHFDHIGGNRIFDLPIIANRETAARMQQYTADWLAENLNSWVAQGLLDEQMLEAPRIVMPEILYEQHLTLRLDELTLDIRRLGGHSSDSSIIFIPERKVLFAGDLVFNGKPAAIGEADLAVWCRSLETMQQLGAEIVIAGHGRPGGPELLAAQLAELEQLRAEGRQ